jgi:hypothetical protein
MSARSRVRAESWEHCSTYHMDGGGQGGPAPISARRGTTWQDSIRLHLVPVDRIGEEEMLDFFGDLHMSAPPFVTSSHPLPPAPRPWHCTPLTSIGDNMLPHSCTSFPNMLYGPHVSTFRSRPKTESSSYVMPISTSSDWTALSAPMGMSSAEGMASRKLHRSQDDSRRLATAHSRVPSDGAGEGWTLGIQTPSYTPS